ncbi:probable ATP-dependent DNA helicase HFM1 isoform X2 [Dunckerocampus dactyliophorus]|uniref:probable ATP-dependent DNA helicase HFM1 isoform X2 n=1 Tax=Dunckerocampus dactyliophorus TaxID=161453 RepID=UPI002404C3D2|nr:probable ATP-dependent DNA helicase HFM1 isoform X2 [Dunckerocampus dactyliophorus]XP_054622740.1 probable ATP-dependent DNA helicase HFM1 isoform X2 [Dunckerocampus dactyliophorus]XP_054622741.1 probable ATP-dependent DNA helicase HFM1 isoform X2 [Dunckerocampus dactyliophorus]
MNGFSNSDDCTLSLDNLFHEKPIVHKVKPLHQEASAWQLESPPSLSQIPTTQVMQEGAESLAALCKFTGFSQKKRSAGNFCGLSSVEKDNEEIQDGSCSTGRYESLWGGEGFSTIAEDESLQDADQGTVSMKYLSVGKNKGPPLQRSLFKVPALSGVSDSSNTNDLCSSDSSGRQTAARPQTFPSVVTMATAPPPHQPPPRVTFSQAAPPSPLKNPFLPLALGSSASSVRSPQQTAHAEMQNKGTKRALVTPMTPQPLHIQGSSESDILRPVSEIPAKFRPVFDEFPFFNYVQSKALDDVLYTDKNFVACAPTGSGKTALFELAIIHLLMETSEPWRDVKAVYMAPIKALCSQCLESWTKKFGPLGLNCKELTGDTEIDDFFEIQDSHIILTTPEKWDSMTRKWRDNCLLQLVRLFLIDEVHVVKDATRGATLEVVVSRMKAVHAYRTAQNPDTALSMRFVAASATIPNISDIADWLSSEKGPATYLEVDESHRPVKLRKVVLGFPCSPNQTEFKFDLSLNYKMANVIQTYSDQKPALVFCSTRKGTQQSAAVLAQDTRFIMPFEHKQRLKKYAQGIVDSKLRDLVMLGVGYHHAGVDMSDRKLIENVFALGDLPVLFTTRTLAMGVNLPAHLVVIKSTMQYTAGSCEEYSEADLLQMIGRAGRPQFDTSATAVIMTKVQTKDKYMKLMNRVEILESSLHSHLVEHLNAEIVLQTINDVNMALDWIRSTFLYIRALKNPSHYGFSANLDRCGIEAKLQELCLKNLNSLSSIGLISMDEDVNIKPTEAGRLMARCCVAFDTMQQFQKVSGTENLSDLIDVVSKSREFTDIQLRMNEKRPLNILNRDKNRITIRFPMEGKIKSSDMKVNCLIQAQLGSISIQEFSLTQDTAKIFRNGLRITKCLFEFLSQNSKIGFSALLNSLILAKCFRAKLWENSPYVSKQLDKIGQTLSTAMVNAGLTTFSKIEQTNAREIELILNRHPPFGNQVKEFVMHLPKYEVTLEQLPRYSSSIAEIIVKVNLKNQAQLLSRRTAPNHHYVSLIIGDSDNNCVFRQKFTDLTLLKCSCWSKKIEVAKALKGDEISVNLISSEYVGLDIQQKFNVYYSGARRFETDNLYNTSYDCAGRRPQQSSPNPQCVDKAAPLRGNTTSSTQQDGGNKRQCNHLCKNKEQCGHDCCKIGVAVVRKRLTNQESGFSLYLRDLRSRCDTLSPTPVKRLKMKMNEESVGVDMQQFSYKAKKLPAVSSNARYRGAPTETRTREDCSQCSHSSYQGDYDDDAAVVDTHRTMEKAVHADIADHIHQGSSGWRNAGLDAARPWQVSHQGNHSNNDILSQIPSVNFDLGNDWDDWSDFDDENLVHASDTSQRLCVPATSAIHQSAECSIAYLSAGYIAPSPHVTSARPPLRSISQTALNKPEPSHITGRHENQIKYPNKLSKGLAVTAPERQTATCVAPLVQRFDFFSTMSVPFDATTTDNSSTNTKEEEAFIGIFDGIF